MISVKAHIEQQHYLTQIAGANNEITSDETLDSGGTGKGFTPSELLASSLAACTAITLRMYADRKSWDLQKADVEVSFETIDGVAKFTRKITLSGSLDDEQRARMAQIANKCPIHKVLSNSIDIQTLTT